MANPISQIASEKRKLKTGSSTAGNGSENANSGHTENAIKRQRTYELEFIAKSGLFDTQFYLSEYPDIAKAGVPALEHFFDFGYREGRRPNLYFDPQWYLKQNPDVQEAGSHPLTHYASYGDIDRKSVV